MSGDAIDLEHVQRVTLACQVISVLFFLGVLLMLIGLNSESCLSLKKAPMERRLNTALSLMKIVATASVACNFFQVSELDDVILPRLTAYTLDASRPVEWILTCPVIQASLVILAGTKVPDYRLFLMPFLSVAVLCMGVVAVNMELLGWRYAAFSLGVVLVAILFTLNLKQIQEVTDSKEGFFSGTSTFRWVSVLTVVTWFPFPIWFILSPEGAEIIEDVALIQAGWCVLNIISKGSVLSYLQYAKMRYVKEVASAEKEFIDIDLAAVVVSTLAKSANDDGHLDVPLETLCQETMDFMGLGKNAQKLTQRLVRAGIKSTARLAAVDESSARDLRLPWELIYVMKRRVHGRRTELERAPKRRDPAQEAAILGIVRSAGARNAEALAAALQKTQELEMTSRVADVGAASLTLLRDMESLQLRLGEYLAPALNGEDLAGLQSAANLAAAAGLGEAAAAAREKVEEARKQKKAAVLCSRRGNDHFKSERLEEAVNEYSEAMRKDPSSALAPLNCAVAYQRLGRWEHAADSAEEALRRKSESDKAHHCRALALLRLDRPAEAQRACWRGLAAHPDSKVLLQVHAEIQEALAPGMNADEDAMGGGSRPDEAVGEKRTPSTTDSGGNMSARQRVPL